MIRLLGGLCKGAPACLFFLLRGREGSLAFQPCSRGRANADLLAARAGGRTVTASRF